MDSLTNWKRGTIALIVFGISFGFVEAAIVDYLGVLYEPARQRVHSGRSPDDVFPLLTLDQLRAVAPEQLRLLGVEVARELATLLMLGAVALLVARNAGQWMAAFAIAFGTWDVCYYLFLKVLLNWPASLFTWDLLYLVPVPWAAPVFAPLIVSVSMIAGGMFHLRQQAVGKPVRPKAPHWVGVFLGATVIVLAFTLDYRHVMAGGVPQSFNWALFGIGLGIGIASYIAAVWNSTARRMKAEPT